ncbi:tudor and KH domain-containing protein homolog isoform X2 [Sitodiplosis mosellana]|uniref:tudor and KH domain-containing protein homolog isoform X2 n=1 Tax=Sitodiplosis mosellana TaxID=263140 RepID=UPI00244492B6|nr:tudor and KH domain-containing protein homolog isoform X2 [Sitodiplosis mosellana]XP_055299659.1 tudor and KH domain-containing protein homolog isoform X2 [Sitodiplosis mosellana]XP_055299660.1 tudor and KH domain-containing protein homolog isoform X2 [Sitodiplosis mosellana]
MKNVQVLPVVVGITLCTASAALFYKWYKTRNAPQDRVDGASPRPKWKAKTQSKNTKIDVTIPNDTLQLVMGRAGANVKAIEERTGVKISFRDKDGQNQFCEITGPYESVMKAASSINDEIKRSQSVTEDIIIPKSTHEKISLKILRDICHETATKIRIEGGLEDKTMRKVNITGTFPNVQKAKRLIEDQVRQDLIDRETESKPSPQPTLSAGLLSNIENFNRMPSKLGGQMEVYVSAVASPARFWVQIVSPQIKKLDELINEMTEYYSQAENKDRHRIKDPYLGQIVAAAFQYDNKWYRAEIVAIVPNEYDPRRVALDLYFLDFGDSIYVDPHDVYELRTDFLTLRYQAIECFLANVQPVHPVEGTQWNHEAINKFEELTHVAKWKKLNAKTVKTRERFRTYDANQRESSTIPGIELYDIIDDHEVSLASILILENFAVPANQDDAPTPLSRYSSSENVLRLDGGSNPTGSVAEKAMMFELTANIQNSRNTSPMPKSNGSSSDGQRSPRFSSSPRRNNIQKKKATKEKNNSVKNLSNGDDKSGNFQELLTQQLLANKSWSELMDSES